MRSLALALSALAVAAAFAGCSTAGGDESSTPGHVLEMRNERDEEVHLQLRIIHTSGEVVFDDTVTLAPGATETRPMGSQSGHFSIESSASESYLKAGVLLSEPRSTLLVVVTPYSIAASASHGSGSD